MRSRPRQHAFPPVGHGLVRLRPTGRVRTRSFLPFALLLLFLVFPVLIHAQFSGPALGANSPVNLPQKITTDPAILYPAAREIILGRGDQIVVHLFGTVDFAPATRISLDGSVQVPLLGIVPVAGLTLHQAERLIADDLIAAGMYRDPQVNIQLTDSPNQIITVVGEVHGVVPVLGSKRLYDVIAASGGLPATASHIITINRPGLDQPIVVDLGADPARSARSDVPLFAGDTVIVARVGVVYVLGAFQTQGAIPIQQNAPLTLMQVAALGGGPGFQGKLSDLRLIRTVGVERRVVHVDLDKVIKGQAPDPVLQADDIVFLPTSSLKAAIKVGGIGTLLGVISLLIFTIRQ